MGPQSQLESHYYFLSKKLCRNDMGFPQNGHGFYDFFDFLENPHCFPFIASFFEALSFGIESTSKLFGSMDSAWFVNPCGSF